MATSLRSRLWLSYMLLVGVVLCMVGAALLVYFVRNPAATRLELFYLQRIAGLATQRAASNPDLAAGRYQAAAQQAGEALGVRVAVLDASGQVLADSRLGSQPPIPGARLVRRGGPASFRDGGGQVWLYDLRSLAGGVSLVVASPRPRPALWAILRDEMANPFARAAAIALLLSLLLAYWIARWVAAPLQRMAQSARAAAGGDYRPIALEGPREVQGLAQAFNEMTGRVQASRQAQRDFIANVSHELKTPLTSIQGFSQAIIDGTAATPEAVVQAAGVIQAEAGRMNRLVMELLDLARLEAGTADVHKAPVDLGKLLRGVVEKFGPQAAGAQVALLADIEPAPAVAGDAERLGQVFANLVDNALKFTPAGGQVQVCLRQAGERVEAAVLDSGPGIAAGEEERIFERFYQADRSRRGGPGRGVGLGLSIAREIVAAHGGTIHARNNPVHGCAFVVNLPAAEKQQP